MDKSTKRGVLRIHLTALLLTTGLLTAGCERPATEPAAPAETTQQIFPTTEAAVAALHDLIGKYDEAAIDYVFGPGSVDLFASGDPDQDQEDFQRVKAMIEEGVAFAALESGLQVALLGADRWAWPIPLTEADGGWRFDTDTGREELLNRRIGRNELATLTSLRAVVDAQAEFASEGRDGNPPAFATRFISSEGKRDGLYWPPVEGEPLSPLGDLLAEAEYTNGAQEPFDGYFYRILTSQGPAAPGGERSYLDDAGLLTGGFAVIAWPAKYDNSGVMTFLVNHRGIVFQKDLGADTAALATQIETFDPDVSWSPTADTLETVATD